MPLLLAQLTITLALFLTCHKIMVDWFKCGVQWYYVDYYNLFVQLM